MELLGLVAQAIKTIWAHLLKQKEIGVIIDMHSGFPSIQDIYAAARRIEPLIHRTPVLTCGSIDRIIGAKLFFKCENFQKVGAFKIRGATNAVLMLNDESASRGVATHSSGNHAAALAMAARARGIPAYVVMPENAPAVKRDAVAGYCAHMIFCKPALEARESTLAELIKETGAKFIHPYNDYGVVVGQATAALELIEDVGKLDIMVTPVGGGGLTSGTALTVHYISPETRMIAAEPAKADDAYRSFKAGRLIPSENPLTIADGLCTSLGDKTFPIILNHVDEIITVTEEGIVKAMRYIWERMKIVIEPSAAVPLGALLENNIDVAGKRIGIIISGGNVDLDSLP